MENQQPLEWLINQQAKRIDEISQQNDNLSERVEVLEKQVSQLLKAISNISSESDLLRLQAQLDEERKENDRRRANKLFNK